jgi:hypothetical protein
MQSHVKRLAQVVLVSLSGMIADGFFYSANAQCAATDKIYIDPRLVPKRLHCSREDLLGMMLSRAPPETKNFILQQCMQQGQPIVVPYGTGKVLVDPTNPCIQQYIP